MTLGTLITVAAVLGVVWAVKYLFEHMGAP